MTKEPQKNLYFQFRKFVFDNHLIKKGDRAVVACSGGPDSVCLLFLLAKLSKEINFFIVVAHYNHLLRGREADRDEKFVKELAKKFGYKFCLGKPAVGEKIKNEEQARILRYQFLQELREGEKSNKIFIAHNQNDLAETVLMNLIRGTGIRGLCSMKIINDRLIRPLLFAKKSEILDYLEQNRIKYLTDSSNDSLVYTRNIMRHKIIPMLEELNPRLTNALSRASELAQLSSDYIQGQAETILNEIREKNKNEIFIKRKNFISLSPAIQYEIVRILAKQYGIERDLSLAQIDGVIDLIRKNQGKKEKILGMRLKIGLLNAKIRLSKLKDGFFDYS